MFDALYDKIAKVRELPRQTPRLIRAERAYISRHLQRRGRGGSPTKKYSPSWAEVRRRAGLQAERHDYHFTGRLHEGLVLRMSGGDVVMEAEDYAQYLQERFPEHFGFGGEDEYRAVIEDLQNFVKEWLR